MVKWLDLLNPSNNKAADSIVRPVIGENLGPSRVVLPKKYLDILDRFDKAWADRLPQHKQHNLDIELEADKQPLFGPIYDFSRLKLDVLCEYINKILAKRFITPSKSLLRALMLFTNKKDRDLRLWVDYRSLNMITKKTSIYYL